MKGWIIFGDLLKYGSMWWVGVNEIIELIFFRNVIIGDIDIEVGCYGFFVIVNKDNWEFIIYKNV